MPSECTKPHIAFQRFATVTLADLGITHFYGEGMGRGEMGGTPIFQNLVPPMYHFLTSLQTKATAIQLQQQQSFYGPLSRTTRVNR